jgi:hypothetical protein
MPRRVPTKNSERVACKVVWSSLATVDNPAPAKTRRYARCLSPEHGDFYLAALSNDCASIDAMSPTSRKLGQRGFRFRTNPSGTII